MNRRVARVTTFSLVFLAAVLLGTHSDVSAQDIPRSDSFETPRGLAMGSGVRSSASSTSAAAYNAAALPLARLYHIEAGVRYLPGVGRWSLGGTVVDSSTNKFAVGLSFRGIFGNDDEGYSGFDGRVSGGMTLGENLSIGVAGRYFSFTSDSQDETAVDPGSGLTFDASLVLSLEGLRVAALAENFINTGTPLAPIRLGGSASYTIDEVFTIGGDVLFDMTTFEDVELYVGGGAEYLAGGMVPIRVGYVHDSGRNTHTVTGGLGYMTQRIGFEVSLSHDISGANETQIMGSARYFVH